MKEDKNFLGRWLNDNLTEEEKKEFDNTEDHIAFSDIIRATENLDRPKFEVDQNFKKQLEYNKNFTDTSEKKVKIIPLKSWLYSAAAVALVLIGLQIFIFTDTTIRTEIGETQSIELPDGSTVVLNAVSSITYDKRNFNKERTLQLEGEAFFKVAKGSKFSVRTNRGEVAVLGTEFNVYDRNQTFSVDCFEGKVAVTLGNQREVITAGQGVLANATSSLKGKQFSVQEPFWVKGRSVFKDISIQRLVEELQIQYKIKIVNKNVDLTRSYSGFFVHNNVQQALKTSFEPMNISYIFIDDTTIEISNK